MTWPLWAAISTFLGLSLQGLPQTSWWRWRVSLLQLSVWVGVREREGERGEGCPVQLDAPQGRELHQLRSPEIAKQTSAPSALAILLDMRPLHQSTGSLFPEPLPPPPTPTLSPISKLSFLLFKHFLFSPEHPHFLLFPFHSSQCLCAISWLMQ